MVGGTGTGAGTGTGTRTREVSESCMEGVIGEMVRAYWIRFFSSKPELAARRIEAIGYQVGHQLSERSPPPPDHHHY
ncbi:putative trafficking protein particle complex subunit 6B [Iris pallida]|uniref:Trafficking protein particle complex subunit 6B n=1 Tax=Iris pallida TaxID=29817 RepID=A0AAX6HK76_IRIPA|nr:putative trafficking protein particle complex subunit 6B [Iris pallida]